MTANDPRGRMGPVRAMKALILALALLSAGAALWALGAGGAGSGEGSPTLDILSFNVHNLFDGKDDGNEYPDFSVKEGNWSESLFKKRIGLTASLIVASCEGGPDVACLQEVENEAALAALASACSPSYPYLALLPAKASPINCGLLCRYPILELKAHATSDAAKRRFILEAEIEVEGKRILILVNHWKSKVEGAKETEPRRIEEALLLAARIRELAAERPGLDIVAAGDFNEGPGEWGESGGAYPLAFPSIDAPASSPGPRSGIYLAAPDAASFDALAARVASKSGGAALAMADPWLAAEPGTGSYWHSGAFERIDHFLLSRSLFDGASFEYAGFETVRAPFALDAGGKPLAWNPRTGTGYSDHFPILLRLALR